MFRVALILAVVGAVIAAGCKGNSGSSTPASTPTPSPFPTLQVTAIHGGQALKSQAVVESSDYNFTTYQPIGILDTETTNASGVAMFSNVIQGSRYCFSYSLGSGAANNTATCQIVTTSSITLGS